MTMEALQEQVLSTVRASGRVRPADLVSRVAAGTRASEGDVRDALRGLVERRVVGLNWHGEFEVARPTRA
jgi:hypothetical protein